LTPMFDFPLFSFILLKVLVKMSPPTSSSSLSTVFDALLLLFRPFGIDWTWIEVFLLKNEGRSSSSSSSSSLHFLLESGLSRPFFSSFSSSSSSSSSPLSYPPLSSSFFSFSLSCVVYEGFNSIDIRLSPESGSSSSNLRGFVACFTLRSVRKSMKKGRLRFLLSWYKTNQSPSLQVETKLSIISAFVERLKYRFMRMFINWYRTQANLHWRAL